MQNSKIILFGEYALLNGAQGLAIPFRSFSGELVFPKADSFNESQKWSNRVLAGMLEWIENQSFYFVCQLHALQQDIQKGIFFESSISEGYGLGSSGALVAALYKKYFQIPIQTEQKHIREDLAILESYFHGKSSGTDPLVSFVNQPVLLNSSFKSKTFAIPDSLTVFLIDTGITGKTKGMVELFLDRTRVATDLFRQFIHLNNRCVEEFLSDSPTIFDTIRQFCLTEQQFLPEMFPRVELLFENERYFSGQVAIKLCGSGGGGFLLGFARGIPFAEVNRFYQERKVPIIEIQAELIPGYGNKLISI